MTERTGRHAASEDAAETLIMPVQRWPADDGFWPDEQPELRGEPAPVVPVRRVGGRHAAGSPASPLRRPDVYLRTDLNWQLSPYWQPNWRRCPQRSRPRQRTGRGTANGRDLPSEVGPRRRPYRPGTAVAGAATAHCGWSGCTRTC